MKRDKYDFLIVGAGLCGCILANLLATKNYSVLLVDKEDHIGGACYSKMEYGIEVHKFGPHIYRTNKKENWDYLSQFSPLDPFINEPIACYYNNLYNMPFNMNMFNKIWPDVITPEDAKRKIKTEIARDAEYLTNIDNLEKKAISLVGRTLYETFIKDYTEKQWGTACTNLPESIITVLPVRFTYNNNYFSAKYQGIPALGYTTMMAHMIGSNLIETELDYLIEGIDDPIFKYADKIIYTGRLDYLFGCCHGNLPYRGAVFHEKIYNVDNFQGVAVMNFTSKDVPFIRRTEHKHFMADNKSCMTILSEEYSIDATYDLTTSYYPIDNKENHDLQALYENLLPDNFYHCGVRGDYQPYTMDDIINVSKNLVEKF